MMLNYHVIDLMSGAVFALILVWIVLALRAAGVWGGMC